MYEDPMSNNPGGVYQGGDWISAGIMAGASAYDTYQSQKTAKRNTDLTIAANKAEAELAYQRQMQMWHEQNAYNSPAAQMARFKAAGLNPHLIYGQGNAGNASSIPQYSPPNIQYRYEAGKYGASFAQILPTLMSVGTWMQQMKQSQVQIEKDQLGMRRTDVDIERLRQVIDYLEKKNPRELERLSQAIEGWYPSQQLLSIKKEQARGELYKLSGEMQQQFGTDFWKSSGMEGPQWKGGGTKGEEALIKIAQRRIAEAKASWSDFNITDPQALITLVLNGVLGQAGINLRKPGKAGFKGGESSYPRERPRGITRRAERQHPDRKYRK